MMKKIITLVLMVALAAPVWAQRKDKTEKMVQEAKMLMEKGRTDKALKKYQQAAEKGSAEAQFMLGVCYYEGNGVPQNYSEAVKWWHLAAEQGLADAQYNLGVCYENGQGVSKDYSEAVKWYHLATDYTFKIEVQFPLPLPRLRRVAEKARERQHFDRVNRQYKIIKGKPPLPQGLANFVLSMYKHLTREQRYAIYLGLQKQETNKAIAQAIKVSESTVSREIRRNATRNGKYLWTLADESATRRKCRAPGNRAVKPEVRWRVEQLIKDEQWSPKQISGFLAKEGLHISHETIYRFIREDETGELAQNCRHKMKYAKKQRVRRTTKPTAIRNRVSIHERPAEADGKRFGDWEMDLIVDKENHAILTMIERSTNFLLMSKLKYGKKAIPLAKTVWRLLLPYKGDKLLTITTDNGSEFAEHQWITKHLGGVPVYFTDSYSSWQKGAIENTNKLIRQYIPKGTDISKITDNYITKVQKKINRRPREKLNFSTPIKEFYKHYS